MLNTFPELLTYSTLAPFILRVILGLIFLDLAYLKIGKEKADWNRTFGALGLQPADTLVKLYALIEAIAGLLLIVGMYTQIAALVVVIFTGVETYLEWRDGNILKRNLVFYVLLFVIALSLLLTGAGAFAVDIPL
jgi:putative oxidoreductase